MHSPRGVKSFDQRSATLVLGVTDDGDLCHPYCRRWGLSVYMSYCILMYHVLHRPIYSLLSIYNTVEIFAPNTFSQFPTARVRSRPVHISHSAIHPIDSHSFFLSRAHGPQLIYASWPSTFSLSHRTSDPAPKTDGELQAVGRDPTDVPRLHLRVSLG